MNPQVGKSSAESLEMRGVEPRTRSRHQLFVLRDSLLSVLMFPHGRWKCCPLTSGEVSLGRGLDNDLHHAAVFAAHSSINLTQHFSANRKRILLSLVLVLCMPHHGKVPEDKWHVTPGAYLTSAWDGGGGNESFESGISTPFATPTGRDPDDPM